MHARVALLIDGDNISANHARAILKTASRYGEITFSRCYVNGGKGNGDWVGKNVCEVLYTGQGSNASDFRLSFEAVELEAHGGYDVFVIATHDSDMCHIVRWLESKGRKVVVVGTSSMSHGLREAASMKHIFTPKQKVENPQKQDDVNLAINVENIISSLLEECDGKMAMSLFGHKMREQHGITAKKAGAKTWTAYFTGGDERFVLVGEGLEAFITLAGCAQNCAESNHADA